MERKVIDLEIVDELEGSGVDAIALVDSPAIEKNFMYFKAEQFVDPKSGESQSDYMGRCVPVLIGEGKDQDQAVAICISTYQNMSIDTSALPPYVDETGKKKQKFAESYTDYPKEAVENARRAVAYAEENGWGDCGMATGKARASQLANEEPISEDTIARMASFERHRQNSETPYGEGCGKLMWDAWGGDAGIEWASRKLKQIREEFAVQGIILPRGEKVVLQAEDQNYDRGLVVELKDDGGYDVQYWYDNPDNIEPVEVKIDGETITKSGNLVYLGYHPELQEFAERPIARIPEEERGREGSDKNKQGDTKTSRGGIEVSEEVESTLKDKIKEHNEKNPQDSQKADLGMLKAVWRRGSGAYSVGTPGRKGMTRSQWAMGRVNAFLKILSGSAPSDKDYKQDNDLLPKDHPKHSEQKMSADTLNLDAVLEFAKTAGFSSEDFTLNGLQFSEESESIDLKLAKGYTVYKYTGSVGSDTRDFCRNMVGMERFYTFAEIDAMGAMAVNPGFGLGGANTYSIWEYKGGPNCKHRWTKFYVNEAGTPENKGAAPGIAGEKPNNMANNGYAFATIEDKMELVGPVAIPDIEIPRKDKQGNTYFVRFSKEVVKRMAEKFMREQKLAESNIQHDGEQDGKSYVYESYIVETDDDKANTLYGLNVPIGTWMIKMRVMDKTIWNKVKSGEVKGFSLEGSFMDKEDYEQYQKDREIYNKVIRILKNS